MDLPLRLLLASTAFAPVLTTACGAPTVVATGAPQADADGPKYLPSAYSDATVDITTDAYGAFAGAPLAPGLGAVITDFTLPRNDGGTFSMAEARAKGEVVLVFFRGFW